LQKGRTGPVSILRELSDILTPGKGPTVDQTEYEIKVQRDPNAAYNLSWNPHRLWILGLAEKDKLLEIVGRAKDYDDVAEFQKRIGLSKFFTDDVLAENHQIHDEKQGLKAVEFKMSCRINY
jgi:type IV pilus assembly protein PilN